MEQNWVGAPNWYGEHYYWLFFQEAHLNRLQVGMKMPHLTHYKNIIYSLHFTNVSIILNSSTWNPSNLLIKLHLTVLECKFVGFNSNNIYNIFNIVKTLQFFSKAKTNVKVAFIFLNTKMSKCVLFIYLFIYSIS